MENHEPGEVVAMDDEYEAPSMRDLSHALAEKMYAFAPRENAVQTESHKAEWQKFLRIRADFEAYCDAITPARDYKGLEQIKLLGKRCIDIAHQHGSRFALYHIFVFSTPGDWIEHMDTPNGDFERAAQECLGVEF